MTEQITIVEGEIAVAEGGIGIAEGGSAVAEGGGITIVEGGVTAAKGFLAAGAHIGLRRKRKDLALLVSSTPATCAAVFTTNVMKGAPIIWNTGVLNNGHLIKAIVINSAYANSATGAPGIAHAKEMAATTADCLNMNPKEVLVASTGVIGVHLPIELVKAGICSTAPKLKADLPSGTNAAEAITTTDTYLKQMAVKFQIDGKEITLGAMAKGSGMVHPNMATTLGFLTTDLAIEAPLLQKALKEVIAETFNMISVDGDTSTNDMVAIMANGLAGNTPVSTENEDYNLFLQALKLVALHMARAVAADGEGATKLIEVKVTGAETVSNARKLAKAVVASNLVKTAVFAEDANWGRIVAALGSSGVEFDYNLLSISISSSLGETPLLIDGMPYWLDESLCKQTLSDSEIHICIEVGLGAHTATAWGCDLSYEYIRKNGNYRANQQLNSSKSNVVPKVELLEEGVA